MSRLIGLRMRRVLGALAAVILIAATGLAAQQVGTITGLVTDSRTGQPVVSVQIFIQGLDLGGLTQQNGRYLLQIVPAGTHELSVARIGYGTVTQQVTVGAGQTVTLNFAIIEQALALDEIIVTGTAGGTQRRAIGNVVERLDVVELQEITPVTSIEQMLSMRVPGLTMQSAGGTIGGNDAQIRIRGSASVGLSNDPLVYIDGVRMNIDHQGDRTVRVGRLNDINPEDIESVEVIKGPAAATLYGTEASNGVIQIITKRGAQGDVQFNVGVGLGANYLRDPASQMFTNYGTAVNGDLIQMNIHDAEIKRFGRSLFRNGLVQQYSLSAQGGTERIRYFAAFNRNDQDGWIRWNWDKSSTGRLNLDLTVNDRFSVGVNASMMSGETRLPGALWSQTMRGSPETALDFGGILHELRGFGNRTPEIYEFDERHLFNTERKNVSVQANWAPVPWLQTRLIWGVDLTDQIENKTVFREVGFAAIPGISAEVFAAPDGLQGSRGLGSREVNSLETQLTTLDYSGTVSYDLTNRIGTATSFGFQYYKKNVWDIQASGEEFATSALSTVGAAAKFSAFEDRIENVTVGFYVQETLSWQDRLFLTGAVRRDENSAFGTDFGAQTYPKVSGTWVLSEEPFWNLDLLNPLRVRGAWGKAGKQPLTFAAERIYQPVTGPGGIPIVTPSNFGNPDLGPERGEEFEIGFDAGFLDERVSVGFTQYWKTTQDAIVNAPVRPSLAFPGTQFVNVGQVDNWGTEVSLDVQLLQRPQLRWDIGVAFSYNDNEIKDLGDIDRIPLRRGTEHVQGFPLSGFHEFKVVSADFESGSSGDVTNLKCDSGIASGGGFLQGGPAVDCNVAPRVFWGGLNHTQTVNLTSTWTVLENWRLYVSVLGQRGGVLHADQVGAKHTSWTNSLAINVQTDPVFMGQVEKSRNATGLVDNGYLAFQELGLQYQLPISLAQRMGASRASIAVSARNIGTIWREQMRTPIGNVRVPDVRQSIGGNEFAGQQDTQTPLSSLVLMRVRLTF